MLLLLLLGDVVKLSREAENVGLVFPNVAVVCCGCWERFVSTGFVVVRVVVSRLNWTVYVLRCSFCFFSLKASAIFHTLLAVLHFKMH